MRHYSYFFILCFLFIFTCLPGRAMALSVDDVRFGTHPEKIRMVLDLSECSDFRVFLLPNPKRLVIDMPHLEWKAGAVGRPAKSAISNIRQGNLNPAISRIVFELDSPIEIESAFVLKRSGGNSDRLVIDYSKVSESAFLAQKGKIFGNLKEDGSVTSVKTHHVSAAKPVKQPVQKIPELKPLVVIDPGHGGKDPGAVGYGKIYEKNITLAAAKELQRQLLATGMYRVILTRETDIYLKLRERVNIARKAEADLFISIHADSIENSKVRGASVYTISKKASDAQTAKLAERENQVDLIGMDLSGEDEDVAVILTDLLVNDTMNQSKFFANTLTGTISTKGTKMLPNPHRSAGFAVLKAPDIPSVLIEIGFLSNAQEAKMLSNKTHRKKIVSSIKAGIDAYFERVRKNNRT